VEQNKTAHTFFVPFAATAMGKRDRKGGWGRRRDAHMYTQEEKQIKSKCVGVFFNSSQDHNK
jgi:hypothetical protein